jgi:hypothetical protein
MKIILDNRGSGKTKKLILESAETGAVIVAINYSMVQYCLRFARHLNVKIPEPITFSDFISGHYRTRDIPGLLIDDADVLIRRLSQRFEVKTVVFNIQNKAPIQIIDVDSIKEEPCKIQTKNLSAPTGQAHQVTQSSTGSKNTR